jgi:hypothetical protein
MGITFLIGAAQCSLPVSFNLLSTNAVSGAVYFGATLFPVQKPSSYNSNTL